MQWKHSNEHQLNLRNVDYEAAGEYSCEVSTDTPIFTRESNVDLIHVIGEMFLKFHPSSNFHSILHLLLSVISVPQTSPPKISFSKRQFYIGENLVANCTTSKARPPPHITWLINGKKVSHRNCRRSLSLLDGCLTAKKKEKKD